MIGTIWISWLSVKPAGLEMAEKPSDMLLNGLQRDAESKVNTWRHSMGVSWGQAAKIATDRAERGVNFEYPEILYLSNHYPRYPVVLAKSAPTKIRQYTFTAFGTMG